MMRVLRSVDRQSITNPFLGLGKVWPQSTRNPGDVSTEWLIGETACSRQTRWTRQRTTVQSGTKSGTEISLKMGQTRIWHCVLPVPMESHNARWNQCNWRETSTGPASLKIQVSRRRGPVSADAAGFWINLRVVLRQLRIWLKLHFSGHSPSIPIWPVLTSSIHSWRSTPVARTKRCRD